MVYFDFLSPSASLIATIELVAINPHKPNPGECANSSLLFTFTSAKYGLLIFTWSINYFC